MSFVLFFNTFTVIKFITSTFQIDSNNLSVFLLDSITEKKGNWTNKKKLLKLDFPQLFVFFNAQEWKLFPSSVGTYFSLLLFQKGHLHNFYFLSLFLLLIPFFMLALWSVKAKKGATTKTWEKTFILTFFLEVKTSFSCVY